VTFSGKRAARVLLTMYPEELNSRSLGSSAQMCALVMLICPKFNQILIDYKK